MIRSDAFIYFNENDQNCLDHMSNKVGVRDAQCHVIDHVACWSATPRKDVTCQFVPNPRCYMAARASPLAE